MSWVEGPFSRLAFGLFEAIELRVNCVLCHMVNFGVLFLRSNHLRAYQKSTSASFFVPAWTLITPKLFNRQIGTNSILERGVLKWDFFNLPAHFHTGISIWKRWIQNGKDCHLMIFSSIPNWAQTLFWNILVTEPSSYGNGQIDIKNPIWWSRVCFETLHGNGDSPFPHGDLPLPVSIWGSLYENR
jgi:hypothetical protein